MTKLKVEVEESKSQSKTQSKLTAVDRQNDEAVLREPVCKHSEVSTEDKRRLEDGEPFAFAQMDSGAALHMTSERSLLHGVSNVQRVFILERVSYCCLALEIDCWIVWHHRAKCVQRVEIF